MATYTLRHGEPLMVDYTPGSDVAAGQLVVAGSLKGVTLRPLVANELGAIAVGNRNLVFDIEKDVTANVFAVGDLVEYKTVTFKAVLNAAGVADVGVCVKASGATDTTVRVMWILE